MLALSHVALVVADPARTAKLFYDLFGVKPLKRIDEEGHDETYFKLGDVWLLLVKHSVTREKTGDHIGFKVSPELLKATRDKLAAMDMEFILARGDTSLYFFDYDNHVFELETVDLAFELSQST